MELDVEGRCGAGHDEKTPERLNSRNGYRDRTRDTRAGRVELKIPMLRRGSDFPQFLEPRPFWTEFLRSLNRRGLRGVKLVISDSHEGVKAAVSKVLKATVALGGVRLVGAMMLEQNDEWSLNRRYMQLEGLQTLGDTVPTRLSAWLAVYRASQPVRAVELHHGLGHDPKRPFAGRLESHGKCILGAPRVPPSQQVRAVGLAAALGS